MLGLGWASGLRSCEYGNATFEEIEGTGVVTIRNSKHNGTRVVPLSEETCDAVSRLKVMLQESGLYPAGGGVFEKSDGSYYTTSSFRRWMKKVAKPCEIAGSRAVTHGLRHRFARNFNDYKNDDMMLADLMGHKSLDTTRNYRAETLETLTTAVREANIQAKEKARAKIPAPALLAA